MARLFFALWPEEELRNQFASISGQIKVKFGRRVAVNNLHITLVFLGNIDEKQKDCILASANRINCSSVDLYLDRVGWWRRPQVVWLAPAHTPGELESLAGELVGVATRCGIPVDDRPFKPHMTLMRKVRKNPHLAPDISPVHWPVSKYALVESVNTPDGVKYEPVWTSS